MSAQELWPRRTISVTDVIEDWGLGWHLGRVVECIYQDGLKGTAIDDLREARWYLVRKIEHVIAVGEDDTPPVTQANIDAATLIEDWRLPGRLSGLLSVLYHRRTLDVPMLRAALGFLEQRIRALQV